MVPTAFSQLVEQIVNAVISIVAGVYLYEYGTKVAALLRDEAFAPAWGAAGGGMTPMDAARCAVYIHGLAGDIAASQIGETGMTAMDIAEALPRAFLQTAGR